MSDNLDYLSNIHVFLVSNVFINICLKSTVAILIFLPLLFRLNLSDDLNNILKNLVKKVNS